MKTTVKITIFALILNALAAFPQTVAEHAQKKALSELSKKINALDNKALRKAADGREKNLSYRSKELYFGAINLMEERSELLPLNDVEMPENSMEVRVWTLQSFVHPTVYRLLRQNGEWKAFSGVSYEVTPASGWTNLWDRLEALDFLTLPDSSPITPHSVTYIVEINDGGNYRIYHYNSPHGRDAPKAKKMATIIDLLLEELRAVNPKMQPAATITEPENEPETPFASLTAESLSAPQGHFFLDIDDQGNIISNRWWYEAKKIRIDPDTPEVAEYVRIATDYVVNKRNINMPDDVIPITEIQGENMIVTLAWYSPEKLTKEALAMPWGPTPDCYFGVHIDIKTKKTFTVRIAQGRGDVAPERERRKKPTQ